MGIWGVIEKAVGDAARAVSSGGRNERNESSSRTLGVGSDGRAPSNARIGDIIHTANGDFKITDGTPGHWTSEKVASGGNGGRDWSSVIYDPTSTQAQKQEAYYNRAAKEREMRANGTWNNSWIPTSELQSVIRSDYNAAQNSTNPYASASADYSNVLQANNDQARELYANMVRQGTDRLNAQKYGINRSYDDAATNAYISYMQGQRQLPQQLAAAGITGGAAESSTIGARAGYESNVNQVNMARQKALSDIESAIVDLQNSGDVQTAQYILNNADKIADNYVQALYSDIGRSDTMKQNEISNAYERAGLTGDLNGTPTLQSRQFDFERQQYQDSLNQYEYEKQLDLAWKAAQVGDYSKLRALGINPVVTSGSSGGAGKKKKKSSGSNYPAASHRSSATEAKPKPSLASMMTGTEWVRHKNSGNSKDPAMVFDTYADYVNAYKQALASD